MIGFDKDEKYISDAIDVLGQELTIPDLMPGIRRKLDVGHPAVKTKRKAARLMIVAAVVVFALVLTAAAISLGGFDWLLKNADPPFAGAVSPVEQSVVSQGIKITAAAAGSSGDRAVLYVTLEDTEQLGRVSEDTEICFSLNSGVQSMSAEQIFFDSETGIAAYQLRLGASDTFDRQSLTLKITGIRYGREALGEVPVEIDLAQAAAQGEHIGQPYSDPSRAPSEQLTPGYLAEIPGTDSAWISAIGINHGYLAVQFAQPVGLGRLMNANSVRPYLLDDQGNRIDWNGPGGVTFKTDEQLEPADVGDTAAYEFMEVYFDVDTEALVGFTLCFDGSVWNVISGEWNLNINFDSLKNQTRSIKTDVSMGEIRLEDVVIEINPFGMTLTGNCPPEVVYAAPMGERSYLETTDGDVELHSFAGVRLDESSFKLTWWVSSVIDPDSVTAVNIGSNRISMEDG